MGQLRKKVLIITSPRQNEKSIVFQIKALPHLVKYIVGPVSLPVLWEVGEG